MTPELKLNFIQCSTKGKNCFAAVSVRIVADLGVDVQIVIGIETTLAACPNQANYTHRRSYIFGNVTPLCP